TALGQGYQDLRLWPEAAAQFRRGEDLVARLYGPESLDVAPENWELGRCLMFNGQYAEAEPVLRKAMRVYELNSFHIHPVEIRGDLAAADVAKGDLQAAESMLKEAAEKTRTYHIPVARCDPIKSLDDLADKRQEAG